MTIVSGIPRAGTSLMMRMLNAGGVQVLADRSRPADSHNPYGYFEDERVRRLAHDSSWLGEARGKALKVIYRLLPHLPAGLEYRVIFMQRDLDEIYTSQQDMLETRNDPAASQQRDAIICSLALDLDRVQQWIAKQSNFRFLVIPYAQLVCRPETLVATIAGFLDGGLDVAAMAGAIDPALYRHRRPEATPRS